MKQILVPFDFSEYSRNALNTAVYFARVKDMDVKLLHVIEYPFASYYNMLGVNMMEDKALHEYENNLRVRVAEELDKVIAELGHHKLRMSYEIKSGKAFNSIIKTAEFDKADLIILGARGSSPIEHIFLGATAERVIRHSAVPVLTVEKSTQEYNINSIVFASDFQEKNINKILERVTRLAEIFMAKLYLVRVVTPGEFSSDKELEQKLLTLTEALDLSPGSITIYEDKNEEDGIVNFAREVNADLIAICTHGRTGIEHFFKGSIAEEVAQKSTIPVLTYNIGKDRIKVSGKHLEPGYKRRKFVIKKLGE
ncbi:MAG: universal stress protein [Cytophagaceae bacterium]